MLLNNHTRLRLTVGTWFAAVVVLVSWSVAAGASVSSIALLAVLCAAPPGLALLLGLGAPALTVAELLHAVDTQTDGRS